MGEETPFNHDTHQDRIQGARYPSKQSKGVTPEEGRMSAGQFSSSCPRGLERDSPGDPGAKGRSVNEPLAFSRVALLGLQERRLQAAHPAPTAGVSGAPSAALPSGLSPPLPSPPLPVPFSQERKQEGVYQTQWLKDLIHFMQ